MYKPRLCCEQCGRAMWSSDSMVVSWGTRAICYVQHGETIASWRTLVFIFTMQMEIIITPTKNYGFWRRFLHSRQDYPLMKVIFKRGSLVNEGNFTRCFQTSSKPLTPSNTVTFHRTWPWPPTIRCERIICDVTCSCVLELCHLVTSLVLVFLNCASSFLSLRYWQAGCESVITLTEVSFKSPCFNPTIRLNSLAWTDHITVFYRPKTPPNKQTNMLKIKLWTIDLTFPHAESIHQFTGTNWLSNESE